MIKKEIKEYARGNSFNYRINIAKQDNLPNEVYILTPTEYNDLINENETLKEGLDNKNTEINKLKNKIKDIEENIKTIQQLEQIQQETIENINKNNNENISNITREYNEDIKKLTALNTVLITGLETIKEISFIDRITNKNKQIATKIINNNTKEITKYKVLETVKEE